MNNYYHDNSQHIDNSRTINISASSQGLSDIFREFLRDTKTTAPANHPKTKKVEPENQKVVQKKPFLPTLAVFSKGKNTTDIQLSLCYQALILNNWIDEENPDAFMDLFKSNPNDCKIHIGDIGVGNIQELFRVLVEKNLILEPQGVSYTKIIQSHFVDKNNNYINLRGAKLCDKAQQVIQYCMLCFEGRIDPKHIHSAFDSALE